MIANGKMAAESESNVINFNVLVCYHQTDKVAEKKVHSILDPLLKGRGHCVFQVGMTKVRLRIIIHEHHITARIQWRGIALALFVGYNGFIRQTVEQFVSYLPDGALSYFVGESQEGIEQVDLSSDEFLDFLVEQLCKWKKGSDMPKFRLPTCDCTPVYFHNCPKQPPEVAACTIN